MLNHHRKGPPAVGLLNCIVVEDNNKQSALLRDYIAKTPKLNYAGKCESAAETMPLVIQTRADIIFWDIRLLDNRIMIRLKESGYYPIVICIAGKPDQEKKETEMDIFSYLNRPLSFERFLTTVNKIKGLSRHDHIYPPLPAVTILCLSNPNTGSSKSNSKISCSVKA